MTRTISFASRLTLLVAMLVSLPAIAKNPFKVDTVAVPKDVAGAPADTLGSIIGTIGIRKDNGPRVDGAALVYRKIGSTEEGLIQSVRSSIGAIGNLKDIKEGKFHYAAFSIDLPEGSYEIIRVVGVYGVGGCVAGNGPDYDHKNGGLRPSNPKDFSIPFEVKRGQALYLGSFLAHGTLEKGQVCFIPIPAPGPVYFSYADKWQRDQTAFATLSTGAPVEHANLAVNERADYYILAEDHVPEAKWGMRDYSAGRTTHAAKIATYVERNGGAAAQQPGEQATQVPETGE